MTLLKDINMKNDEGEESLIQVYNFKKHYGTENLGWNIYLIVII